MGKMGIVGMVTSRPAAHQLDIAPAMHSRYLPDTPARPIVQPIINPDFTFLPVEGVAKLWFVTVHPSAKH